MSATNFELFGARKSAHKHLKYFAVRFEECKQVVERERVGGDDESFEKVLQAVAVQIDSTVRLGPQRHGVEQLLIVHALARSQHLTNQVSQFVLFVVLENGFAVFAIHFGEVVACQVDLKRTNNVIIIY